MANFANGEGRVATPELDHYTDLLSKKHPVLPSNACVGYLAEGAANVVYTINIPPPTPGESELPSYGDGTPPPTETDFRLEEQPEEDDRNIWDGGEAFHVFILQL